MKYSIVFLLLMSVWEGVWGQCTAPSDAWIKAQVEPLLMSPRFEANFISFMPVDGQAITARKFRMQLGAARCGYLVEVEGLGAGGAAGARHYMWMVVVQNAGRWKVLWASQEPQVGEETLRDLTGDGMDELYIHDAWAWQDSYTTYDKIVGFGSEEPRVLYERTGSTVYGQDNPPLNDLQFTPSVGDILGESYDLQFIDRGQDGKIEILEWKETYILMSEDKDKPDFQRVRTYSEKTFHSLGT